MTVARIRPLLAVACLAVVTLLIACDQQPSSFPTIIRGTWLTHDAVGQPEQVCFDSLTVTFACGTDDAVVCDFQSMWFDEKERTMSLVTPCEDRTGTSDPVHFYAKLLDDNTFHLILKDRVVGIYTRVGTEAIAPPDTVNVREPLPDSAG